MQNQKADVLVTSGADRASVTVTREEFEDATSALLERTLGFTREALKAAKEKGVERVDRVLLVGGSSKMPAVARPRAPRSTATRRSSSAPSRRRPPKASTSARRWPTSPQSAG